jgi:hypothetical protein
VQYYLSAHEFQKSLATMLCQSKAITFKLFGRDNATANAKSHEKSDTPLGMIFCRLAHSLSLPCLTAGRPAERVIRRDGGNI